MVGAGHNGLTAGAMLARAGLATLVVERRELVGGCCVTEEIAPGCRASTTSYIASMLRPEVIRELRLGRHGLRMIPCEPSVQVALDGGEVLAAWGDTARTAAEIRRFSAADARAFVAADAELRALAARLQPLFMQLPPDTRAIGLRGYRELLRLGRSLRGVRGTELDGLTRLLTGSLGQFIDARFESPQAKALLLANNLYGKHGGPYQPGTLLGLAFHLLSGGEQAEQGFFGHVMGGMGAISDAIASAGRAAGMQIATAAPVARILVRGGRATGIALEDGTEVGGRHGAFRRRPEADLPAPGRRRTSCRRTSRPRSPGSRWTARAARSTWCWTPSRGSAACRPTRAPAAVRCSPSRRRSPVADACYDRAKRGELADADRAVHRLRGRVERRRLAGAARPPHHDLLRAVPALPAGRRAPGTAPRDELGDRVLARIGGSRRTCPAAVVARQVLTPLDLERDYGLTEGNIFHGDISPDQLFHMRPVPGWARYATPVERLYLCGAGAHPGRRGHRGARLQRGPPGPGRPAARTGTSRNGTPASEAMNEPIPLETSLPGPSYTSEREFAREREAVLFADWFCVGREESVPGAG